ncbi:SMI1/KNR4 family protein [Rhodospirillum sp. A1_3_36]|uniref:SMI1/KNR4 family protein n=1 Tax=Rhodospirillum sp. A1_3_36 TaxID=3391666 RepID=UPI0039A4CA09
MQISMREVVEEINLLDDPKGRAQLLPSDALIDKYENLTGIKFSDDYKFFLKSVSNAFVGTLSPFTLNEEFREKYGDLLLGLKEGREVGVPHDWLPICEDNGDYYCLLEDGTVRFWSHDGQAEEMWPDLASWAKEVWLDEG